MIYISEDDGRFPRIIHAKPTPSPSTRLLLLSLKIYVIWHNLCVAVVALIRVFGPVCWLSSCSPPPTSSPEPLGQSALMIRRVVRMVQWGCHLPDVSLNQFTLPMSSFWQRLSAVCRELWRPQNEGNCAYT